MKCRSVMLYFDSWEEAKYYFRNVKLELEELKSNYKWSSCKYTLSFFKRLNFFKRIMNKLFKRQLSDYIPVLDITFASINSYKYKDTYYMGDKDDGYYPSYKGTKEYPTEQIVEYILNIL